MVMELDVPTARRYALEQVTLRGRDFVYRTHSSVTCRNLPFTQEEAEERSLRHADPRRVTGCLVGEILVTHGMRDILIVDPLVDITTLCAKNESWFTGGWPLDSHGPDFTWDELEQMPEVAGYLMILQRTQDAGYTWGEAYDRAEEYLSVGAVERANMLAEDLRPRWAVRP